MPVKTGIQVKVAAGDAKPGYRPEFILSHVEGPV
jgi:hypothetical protein